MATKLYNQEAEQQLLGLLLSDSKFVSKISGLITDPGYFYINYNKFVFEAITKSHEHYGETSTAYVVQYLGKFEEKSEEEWMQYLIELKASRGLESDFEKLVQIVIDKHQVRDLERTLKQQLNNITKEEKPISDLVSEIENEVYKVTSQRELKDFESIAEVTKEFTREINNPADRSGIKTNLKNLDDIIGSFQPGQLILLAARPSMGKTAVSIQFAKEMARNHNVGYFSIEMPSTQIVERMMKAGTLWTDDKIKDPKSWNDIEKETYESVSEQISALKMNIDDSPGIELGEISWKARKLAEQGELDAIIIDYIGLINHTIGNNNNQVQIVADISKQLKALARDLEIPVIALAQLNRSVEKREDKRPMMSDLRDSGSLEQDADIIMFLYRDGYYNTPLTEQPYQELEVLVSKNRNGSTGTAKLKFYMSTGRITS